MNEFFARMKTMENFGFKFFRAVECGEDTIRVIIPEDAPFTPPQLAQWINFSHYLLSNCTSCDEDEEEYETVYGFDFPEMDTIFVHVPY